MTRAEKVSPTRGGRFRDINSDTGPAPAHPSRHSTAASRSETVGCGANAVKALIYTHYPLKC